MKRIKLNKKRQTEFDRIVEWFLHGDHRTGGVDYGVLGHISNPEERSMTTVKILSRLACLQDKLTDDIK